MKKCLSWLLCAVILIMALQVSMAEGMDLLVDAETFEGVILESELDLNGPDSDQLVANDDTTTTNTSADETITVSKDATKKVYVGTTYQIVAKKGTIVSCKSSKTGVAEVTNEGLITLKKAGTAKITVKTDKKKYVLTLKVIDPTAATSVTITNGKKATLSVGDTLHLTYKLSPSTATNSIKWTSNKKSVATVNASSGIVTANKAGKAVITAKTSNGKKATIAITVKKAETTQQPEATQQPPEQPEGSQPPEGQQPPEQPEGSQPPEGQQPPEAPEGSQPPEGQQPPEQPEGSQPPEGQQPPEAPEGSQPPEGQQPPEAPEGSQPPEGQQPPEQPEGSQPPEGQQPPEHLEGSQPPEGQQPPEAPEGSQPPEGQQQTEEGTTAVTLTEDSEGQSYASTTGGENAVLVSGSTVTMSTAYVSKTGDSSSEDADFYGTNAAILAKSSAMLTIKDSEITTAGSHANAVFSYGMGTTVNVSNSSITTTGNNSGGIMTTGGGTMNATNLTVKTSGNSSAAIRSDRGGGTVKVSGGSYSASGVGSPAIYSTAAISVSGATLTASNSEAVVIEGGNSVSLSNVAITGNNATLNGQSTQKTNVLIYQSMSGDASEGSSTFKMSGGTMTAKTGSMFHVTNVTTTITLENVTFNYASDSNVFLDASADSWGTSSKNGGKVTLNLVNQDITGAITMDSASSVALSMDSDSTWTLTGDSYITSFSGNLSNVNTNGYILYVNGVAAA